MSIDQHHSKAQQAQNPEVLDNYFRKLVTDAQNLADRYSLKVQKQIIKSQQLRLQQLQKQQRKNKRILQEQQSVIQRILSQSSFSKYSISQAGVPAVVERLLQSGEKKKAKIQEAKKSQIAIQLSENKKYPAINKSSHRMISSDQKLPIYERYPQILRQRQQKKESLQVEIEYEKAARDPDEHNPNFKPDLDKTQNYHNQSSLYYQQKQYGNFFDFLRDVKHWNQRKENKIEQLKKEAISRQTEQLQHKPAINNLSRKIMERKNKNKKADVLERMKHFDERKKLNKSLLIGSMKLNHSPNTLARREKKANLNATVIGNNTSQRPLKSARQKNNTGLLDEQNQDIPINKKTAIDHSLGYIPFLKTDSGSITVNEIYQRAGGLTVRNQYDGVYTPLSIKSGNTAPPPLPKRDITPPSQMVMGIVSGNQEGRSTDQQYADYQFFKNMYDGKDEGNDAAANKNRFNNNTFGGNSRKSSYGKDVNQKQRPSVFLNGI